MGLVRALQRREQLLIIGTNQSLGFRINLKQGSASFVPVITVLKV